MENKHDLDLPPRLQLLFHGKSYSFPRGPAAPPDCDALLRVTSPHQNHAHWIDDDCLQLLAALTDIQEDALLVLKIRSLDARQAHAVLKTLWLTDHLHLLGLQQKLLRHWVASHITRTSSFVFLDEALRRLRGPDSAAAGSRRFTRPALVVPGRQGFIVPVLRA